MIDVFKQIGRKVLDQGGNQSGELQRRQNYLYYQTIKPEVREHRGEKILDGKGINLNFDLNNDQIEFRRTKKDLSEKHRGYFFALELQAPRDEKKFLSTNNISYFFSDVFTGMQRYINKKLSNKKSKTWVKANISQEYIEFIESIIKKFYTLEDDGDRYLNPDLLPPKQQKAFYSIQQNLDKEDRNNYSEIYTRLLNKIFYDSDSKSSTRFPSIGIITFNDQTILEFDSNKFKEDYINLCYYDYFQRFYSERAKKNKFCHSCGDKKDVIHDLPLPMKFYGSTNNLFSSNLKKTEFFRSFAVCEECLSEILIGMNYIKENYGQRIFDLTCYLIPRVESGQNLDKELYDHIFNLFNRNTQNIKQEIDTIREMADTYQLTNLKFDLLFYNSPPGSQQFDILKTISNIDLYSLVDKFELFEEWNQRYKLHSLVKGKYNPQASLSDIRFYLFPSYYSEANNPDFNVYGKVLLDFLDKFIKEKKISVKEVIKRFIRIFDKRYRGKRSSVDMLAPLRIVIFLSILNEIGNIKIGGNMEGAQFTSIVNNDYEQFFKEHSSVYEGNAFKQGLFLLGTIIGRLVSVQEKQGKSSNFLRKLDLKGIPTRRIPKLTSEVKNFVEIYKSSKDGFYEEQGLWGNIMDRLQGIENSRLKPDEVVFYILTGISYNNYLAKMYSQNED